MKKKLLVILSILLPLGLIGAGVAIYFGYFTPDAQAKRIAEQTMHAASTQQKDDFARYGTPDGNQRFYEAAAQRNYRLDSQVADGQTYYSRYLFTDNASPKYARIATSGSAVTALAVGDKLGATPAQDKPEDVAVSNSDFCLTREDLQYLDSTSLYAKTFRGATMIFADDTSMDYSGENNAETLLERIANFYKKTSRKDYIFVVRGYLAASKDTLDERRQVIQNRTLKIQKDLIARGIPRDRVTISDPIAYPIDQPTDGQNERYVIIDIANNCVK